MNNGLTFLLLLFLLMIFQGCFEGKPTLKRAASFATGATTTVTSPTPTATPVPTAVPGQVTIGSISGNTKETGTTATFTVVLQTAPTQNVVIAVASSNTGEGTVLPASLTFTSGNWNIPQTVTITGVDDAITDGSVSYSITLTMDPTSDSAYVGLSLASVVLLNNDNDSFEQQAYIKAVNSNQSIGFGGSIAISGETVVVGAQYESSNQTTITNGTTASSNTSSSNSGAAYIYKRTGTTWVQEAFLKAANSDAGDQFGRSVAISGDTVVVGSFSEDSNQTVITNGTTASSDNSSGNNSAAYVYKRTGTTWAQEAYLKASNGDISDYYGSNVSISGDTVVMGSVGEDSNQTIITNGTTASSNNSSTDSGAVYIYKRTGVSWAQEAYLKAVNSGDTDDFGYSVAVSGDTVVVGAPEEDSNQTIITNGTTASSNTSTSNSGAAYIYKRTGASWDQEAYLKAANAGFTHTFGYSTSISGDTVVVGAPAESSNQTTITNGTTASTDQSSASTGAAYVYKRTGTTWAQEAYLKASNADQSDVYGSAVAISEDTVVVGANSEDSNQTTITNGTTASSDNSSVATGAVYVYKRTGTSWVQQAFLKAVNASDTDYFGTYVAVSGDTVVVGVPLEDSNQTTITNGTTASSNNSSSASGAVYIYYR